MKKLLLIFLTFFFFCFPAFAEYKPIPSNLSKQYRDEITKIINKQYPVAMRETKQIRLKSHKMYLKVLKNKKHYMDYVTNNFDMIINLGEFKLLSKIIAATDKYVEIKNDDALATDYNGALLDFLNPYFKDNEINSDKLDKLGNFVYVKQKEIEQEQLYLHQIIYPDDKF